MSRPISRNRAPGSSSFAMRSRAVSLPALCCFAFFDAPAAARRKLNRSALTRNALREHLRRLEILELEERDGKGYLSPQDTRELSGWESEAAWPENNQGRCLSVPVCSPG